MTFRGPTDPEQFRIKVGRYKERHYFDPLPADDTWEAEDPNEDPYPSVSTIKKVSARDFSPVAARRVAEFAVANFATLAPIVKNSPDAAVDLLIGADKRGLNVASARGTAVHAVMELLAAGVEPNMVNTDPSAFPYLDTCKAILFDLQPEFDYTETVVISRSNRYGGTFDVVMKVNGKWYLVDYKSRKAGGHDAYIEEAWQISAYAKADYWIVAGPDGQPIRIKPPHLDGGLIISICPGDGSYVTYPVDLDKGFDGFVRMNAMWVASHAKNFKPLGKPAALMPRLYVPAAAEATVQAMVDAGAAALPVWGVWDPFGTESDYMTPVLLADTPPAVLAAMTGDPFAGLPTGDAEGSTHPLTNAEVAALTTPESSVPAFLAVLAPAVPVLIGDWVKVTWYESMAVGGVIHKAEQNIEGWLTMVGSDSQVTVTDDNNNVYKIPGDKDPHVHPAIHPDPPHVVPIANQMDEDSVVQPAPVTEAPASVMDKLTHVTPTKTEAPVLNDHEAVRAWLRRRLESDVTQLGGQTALLKYWPVGLRSKALDRERKNVFTDEELHEIEMALENLERDMTLSFREPKPEYVHPEPEVVDYEVIAPTPEEVKAMDEHMESHDQDADRIAQADPVVSAEEQDAHPDDIALIIERAVATSKTFPYTWKRIEEQAKLAGMPNLRKPGVKPSHLTMLDTLITGYVNALAARRAAVDDLLNGLDAMGMLAVIFAAGSVHGEDSATEPTEDYVERISVLTSGLKSGQLEFYKDGDDSQALGVSADTTAALRKLHPENVKLFRVLNPVLTKYGFNSINRVGELRRTPLATMLVMGTPA